jgi:hypothetical protein
LGSFPKRLIIGGAQDSELLMNNSPRAVMEKFLTTVIDYWVMAGRLQLEGFRPVILIPLQKEEDNHG